MRVEGCTIVQRNGPFIPEKPIAIEQNLSREKFFNVHLLSSEPRRCSRCHFLRISKAEHVPNNCTKIYARLLQETCRRSKGNAVRSAAVEGLAPRLACIAQQVRSFLLFLWLLLHQIENSHRDHMRHVWRVWRSGLCDSTTSM